MEKKKPTTPATHDTRYPLAANPTYRACVETVIRQIRERKRITALGGAGNLRSHALTQMTRSGDLNADFMLKHFAPIFDGTSTLSSDRRQAVKAILTEAAGMMAGIGTGAAPEPEEGGKGDGR